jgi:hypothetical protein
MMDIGTLMIIEFFAFFGGILFFGFQQLRSLKKLDERDRAARAAAEANGEPPRPPADPIPGWMARR